jgi:hypothetical protein
LAKGRLTTEDVNNAFDALTSHIRATQPTGWNQPLSWQRGFIGAAVGGKFVSDETVLRLCDAFFGPQPKVTTGGPVVVGQRGILVNVAYGNSWASNSGFGIELLWDVKRVELDGKALQISQPNRFAERWDAYCDGPLTSGDHELKVEVECAYVDVNSAMGMNRSSPLPPSQALKAKKRWATTITTPVKVNAAEEKK